MDIGKELSQLDLNKDGTPDYKEPAMWALFGGLVAKAVRAIAHPNTIAYKVASFYLSKVG